MIPPAHSPDARLVRELGVRQLAATTFNIVIGGGIFVLPAVAAGTLGAAAPMAYVVTAALVGLVVLCFAEAGSRVATTGGPYAYVEVAFGPFAGLLIGVLLYVLNVFASAAVASALAGALGAIWPSLGGAAPRAAIIVVSFAALAALNVRGIRQGTRLVEAVTVAKLLPLALLLVAGALAPWAEPQPLVGRVEPAALARAVVFLIFAFAGTESALIPGAEMRDPARTVPRALGLSMVLITALYVALQVVAQGVLGTAALAAARDAPLAAVAAVAIGAGGALVVGAGAAVSMFGNLSGMMLASPRALYALARDGFLPAPLAAVHSRFRTPHVAIVAHAAITTALAVTGGFAQLAVLATVSALLMYLISCAAAWMLRRRDVRGAGAPFLTPGGPLVPALACAAIAWVLATGATARELAFVALVLTGAAVLYALTARRRRAMAAVE